MIWFSRRMLSAHAFRSNGDPDLPDALHLRLLMGNGVGLPLTPFLVYPLETRPVRLQGELIDNGDGTQRVNLPELPLSAGVIVAAEAISHDPKGGWLAAMHSDGLRIAVKRSREPHLIAAPQLDQLRVPMSVDAVRFYSARPTDLEKLIFAKPPYSPLALPVASQLPWYVGGAGRDRGIKRVMTDAPQRFSPVDRPDGPFLPLTPDDEWARLAPQADDLDGMLAAMLGQGSQTPDSILLSQNGFDDEGVMQSISSQLLSDVLMRSIDPGIARYLGFAAALQDRARIPPRDGAFPALGAVALFALPRRLIQQLSHFGAGPQDAEPDPAVVEAFAKQFPGVEQVLELARKFDYWVGAISTVAAAPPSPDTPEIPGLVTQQGRWRSSDDGGSFAQGFIIKRPPLAPLVAVARQQGDWTIRHDLGAAGRHAIRLVGTRRDPSPTGGQPAETQGIIYDDPIAGSAPPRYRFALGDLFGRYGPSAECDAVAPPRSAPPMPVVQTFIRRAAPLSPGGAVSPGTLDLRVPIPALDDLPLGALPIVTVRVTLGAAMDDRLADGSLHQQSYPLPLLEPMEIMVLDLTVRFIDSAGTLSEAFVEQIEIADARAPVPIPFGYGLIWTSRPGAAQDVQLALDWPAPVGQQHRVYVADAASLRIAGTSRAAIADTGVKRALAGEIAGADVRKCFRLLTDQPVMAGNDGVVRFRSTLPRALQTVQFVRIVPVSGGGVEADFDACGLIPVAVPADRAPPPPRLRLSPALEGRLPELLIEATGLNLALLEQAEPGLFDISDVARATPPEYRIRRASGAVPDPIYAREIARGPLVLAATAQGVQFAASLEDSADPVAYVRYTYWAEIRMPPERRVLETEVPVTGAAGGATEAQMAQCPAIWSTVSAPITVIHAPGGLPAMLPLEAIDARFVTADARIDLTLHDLPPAGPGGHWSLRIWLGLDGGVLAQSTPDTPIMSSQIVWSSSVLATTTQIELGVALVDPIGRQSKVLRTEVKIE